MTLVRWVQLAIKGTKLSILESFTFNGEKDQQIDISYFPAAVYSISMINIDGQQLHKKIIKIQ